MNFKVALVSGASGIIINLTPFSGAMICLDAVIRMPPK